MSERTASSSGGGKAWHGLALKLSLTMQNVCSIIGYKDWGYCYGL
uniref:Uncharacterized protein n=1 Tax=virus sp. ctQ5V6 TaxID=2825815 RepID=A0A8S5RQG7_9VIRU|nr:MAG TPA: hypothetical protein [virus sp. ctQ5V6]